jgi:hypothetical protein
MGDPVFRKSIEASKKGLKFSHDSICKCVYKSKNAFAVAHALGVALGDDLFFTTTTPMSVFLNMFTLSNKYQKSYIQIYEEMGCSSGTVPKMDLLLKWSVLKEREAHGKTLLCLEVEVR